MKLTEEAFSIVSAQKSKLLNFSYIVSHNIRSHSSNISGLIQLMLERRDPVIHNQLIQSLKISSDRLDETLRHLSDLLIIQSKQKVHKEEVQLHELVHTILQTLSLEISATQATIINKIDNNLIVFNDRTYLESSLLNLISNTIKYRRPDVIPEIIISASETENGIKIAVEDNGLGIDLKANREKVFGMFKTFHQHKASRGIGLFITKNQVEAMGGSIAVDSTPLKGSVFSITLPKSTYSNEVVD